MANKELADLTYANGLTGTELEHVVKAGNSRKANTADFMAIAGVCAGLLSLTSGVAITTTDVTAATTLYWVPYRGKYIALYTGAGWVCVSPGELSLALSGGTASRPHDVFVDYNSGVPQLATTAWTNDTTRATALALQDGIVVNSASSAQRYVGTIYLDASKQCNDTMAKRHVWNMYHRRPRPMRVLETTDTWNYTTNTIRQANGSTANQLDFVRGLDEDLIIARAAAVATNGTVPCAINVYIGLDSTTTPVAGSIFAFAELQNVNRVQMVCADYVGYPGIGRHYLAWLEKSAAIGTTTWYGDNGSTTTMQSGIAGSIFA